MYDFFFNLSIISKREAKKQSRPARKWKPKKRKHKQRMQA